MADVKGIPERGKKGTIPKDHFNKWKLNIQEHLADKAGRHYDIRLNPPESDKAYSWAARHLPGPGEKTTAVQTDIHSKDYMGFSGEIPSGYGKGKVDSLTLEDVEVLKSDDDHVKFNRYKGSDSERYIMMRKPGTDEFLFYNYTPTESSKIYKDVPKYKEKYKNVPLDKLDPKIRSDKEVWSPKLDGAHNLVVLRGGKNPDVFSYRKSRKEGDKFIDHTYRTNIYDKRVPKEFKKTILRGELFVPGGRGNETAGLLNSNVWKAREKKEKEGKPLELNVFDVVKWKGKNVEDRPFKEKLKMLQEAEDKIPGLKHTPWATTEKEKETLRRQMLNKENPLTEEGLAIYDLDSPTPRKSKQEDDWDGEIVGTFEASPGSKYEGFAIGGFLVRPEGSDTILRVGSGLDDQTRQEAFQNPDKFKGEWAKFKSQHVHASGKHQAPIFKELRSDKFYRPNEKTANLIIKLSKKMKKSEKVRKFLKEIHEDMKEPGKGLFMNTGYGDALITGVIAGTANTQRQKNKEKKMKKSAEIKKLAEPFQGYITGVKGIPKKQRKTLEGQGYSKVTPDEYVELKTKPMREGVSEKIEALNTAADRSPKVLSSALGAIAGLTTLGIRPKTIKGWATGAAVTGGSALGGYLVGNSLRKNLKETAKKQDKIFNRRSKAMGDAYAVEGSKGRQFYVKKPVEKKAAFQMRSPEEYNKVIDEGTRTAINNERKQSGKRIGRSAAEMAAFSGAVDFIGQKAGLFKNRGLKSALGYAGLFGGISGALQALREMGPYKRKVEKLRGFQEMAKQKHNDFYKANMNKKAFLIDLKG